ncbi:MAG: tryptophan--tRNA ligase [Patescibacteria group bacterium]
MMKKRIFSGVQPSGTLHIGNYLGALKRWVTLQDTHETIFCIVDLHALTVPQEPKLLHNKIREVAALYLAAGIDPAKSTIFVQSHVAAHSQLAWILNCFLPLGWLNRMTQFKDKSGDQKETVSVGLYDYPALMAADILLYDTDLVPTGEDQRQHIELTRDLAQKLNNLTKQDLFTVPNPLIGETGARIMGLDDPTKKMSKSDGKPGHAISLLDTPNQIREKFARAVTDSERSIRYDENRPAITNLLTIYELFSGLEREVIEAKFATHNYVTFKDELADVVIAELEPLQKRFTNYMDDPTTLDTHLQAGAQRANQIASQTLARVSDAIGLG